MIRGRVELSMEPHSVLADGNSHFRELWDDWYLLHVGNRNLTILFAVVATGMVSSGTAKASK